MNQVSYSGESFLTTDEGADALLLLVASFDDGDNSEMVERAVKNDARTVTVQLIVGSRSALTGIPEDRAAEPDSTDVLSELRDRARSLSTQLEQEYADACAAMEYGWDDIYAR
ncbi:hypothetical protein E3T54_02050 [Cryobacterium sp. Sr8]|uniref:hypothetical protein n=1 Tax=Cryobacterium sp. Sr8 TaxID=1259203 RepID=UPI00106C1187|nr:hypothetical protein [Cryobacterium sp. Sr8]TFD81299.1 hypothetical protein E3T54_02050 [Cryobacterium sp. Sr8]